MKESYVKNREAKAEQLLKKHNEPVGEPKTGTYNNGETFEIFSNKSGLRVKDVVKTANGDYRYTRIIVRDTKGKAIEQTIEWKGGTKD